MVLGDVQLVSRSGVSSEAEAGFSRTMPRWRAIRSWRLGFNLWMGDPNYGFEGSIEDLEPILEGSRLPKLEHLGLMNCELADEICDRLAGAKVLPRLNELSLAYGTMTDAGARALANAKGALSHLQRLDVQPNCLTSEGIAAVEGRVRLLVERLKS